MCFLLSPMTNHWQPLVNWTFEKVDVYFTQLFLAIQLDYFEADSFVGDS